MNIVDAILQKNKKYIILISGYLWWSEMDDIVKALADNLKFEVIYVTQLVPDNKLITSSDQINFPAMNEIVKQKLDRDKEYNKTAKDDEKIYNGYIIVSYSFPPERLDFFPDFHISIQTNPVLLTSLTIDIVKTKNIPRMDVDLHLAYLSKSWKTNKINKTIIFQPDFLQTVDKMYGYIFDAIMENIGKKLLGESYTDPKNEKKLPEYPLPPTNQKFEKTSDTSILTQHDRNVINEANKMALFNNDLDDIVLESKTESFDNDNTDEDSKDDNDDNDDNDNKDNKDVNNIEGGSYKNLSKKGTRPISYILYKPTPYYIGNRRPYN